MLSQIDKIEHGELKLQSYSRPPLTAGKYVVHSELRVGGTGGKIPGIFEGAQLAFTVKAPRFNIDSSLIHSVYPLPGSTAAYQDSLPHIVLTRKTLPWERAITTKTSDVRPWLCLLLLSEGEISADPVKKIKVTELLKAGPNTLPPKIAADDPDIVGNANEISVLEIKASLFKNVAPRSHELDFLAHTRQADTTEKENNEENNKGWYSVLVGNRLPEEGRDHSVFLVSLDGYGDLLDGNDSRLTEASVVRLVVLHQWQFRAEGPTFDKLIEVLNENAGPFTVQLKAGDEIKPELRRTLAYGYAPLSHVRRDGSQSLSWYRGPLIPVRVDKPPVYTFKNADEALRFDKQNGVFDISYAVAWQLGRLLALQNAAFSTAISNWKNAYKRDRPIEIAREILNNMGIRPENITALISDIESDEILTDYLIELWNSSLVNQ